jgi:CubicO group peptidase (beta-lactamase class C family)
MPGVLPIIPLLLLALPGPPPTQDEEALARFEPIVEHLLVDLQIPGMSVAILRDQEVLWARGFGYADLERGIEATADTPYHLASVTKSLAAVVLLRLLEKGVLSLEDPITKYGALGASIPNPERYQLVHLMTHSTSADPGEVFRYDGNRYGGLGIAIERASGRTFRDAFLEDIAGPLGMTRTAANFVDPGLWSRFEAFRKERGGDTEIRIGGRVVEPVALTEYADRGYGRSYGLAEHLVGSTLEYTEFGQGLTEYRVRHIDVDEAVRSDFAAFLLDENPALPIYEELARPYAHSLHEGVVEGRYQTLFNAAAGLISTVDDLALFDIALDRDQLLSAETKELAFTPFRSPSGRTLPYGLGWFVEEHEGVKLVWHGGEWHPSISALYLKVPEEDLTLLALANTDALSRAFAMGEGTVLNSGLALPFLRLFVFEERLGEIGPDMDWRAEPEEVLAQLERVKSPQLLELYVKELRALEVMFSRMGAADVAQRLTRLVDEPLQKRTTTGTSTRSAPPSSD